MNLAPVSELEKSAFSKRYARGEDQLRALVARIADEAQITPLAKEGKASAETSRLVSTDIAAAAFVGHVECNVTADQLTQA